MLRAIRYYDWEDFLDAALPGSYTMLERHVPGQFEFVHCCPCGCGMRGSLLTGVRFKPGGARPSWRWDGNPTEPTLDPSVHMLDHWHGRLSGGYWETIQ